MILVKAKLGPSQIHGIGVFAAQNIEQGEKVWEFKRGFDLILDKEEVDQISPAAREQFLNYAYISKNTGKYILCTDDSRFFNHQAAETANVTCSIPADASDEEALECFAVRNIAMGEELTHDYGEFDADPSDVVLA